MLIKELRLKEAQFIFRKCNVMSWQVNLLIIAYYVVAVLATFFDGISLALLVDLITGKLSMDNPSNVFAHVMDGFALMGIVPTFALIYAVVVVLHFVKAGLSFATAAVEGYLGADARRKIQEIGFERLVNGKWENLRNLQIGTCIGSLTEEATNVAKYFMSLIKTVYALVSTLIYIAFAVMISIDISMAILVIGVPCFALLQYLFRFQAKIVDKVVAARQKYYADITERLNNLFQIKVDNNASFHVRKGMERQNDLTRQEIWFGMTQAGIVSFNNFLLGVILLAIQIWAIFEGRPLTEIMYVIAGIGVMGMRALTQVNVVVSNIGNIMAFSGSILPVEKILSTQQEKSKAIIEAPITKIELVRASYSYEQGKGLCDVNLSIEMGKPLFVVGPSGSGKTTLANIVSGLYEPQHGHVIYSDAAGETYDGTVFRPRVGYVTQDIQLFHGSIRDNLMSFHDNVDDEMLWSCLKQAGAADFVKHKGGLEVVITEAGRSLSGGERRRIGIARILIQRPNVLILDEVTVGLDEERKLELLETIKILSQSMIVMSITHDEVDAARDCVYQVT